jgi:hypothetical protein
MMTKGLTRTGFKEDLKIGSRAEGKLAMVLRKEGGDIEVKSDQRAHLTHNIYVEFSYKGKPSGIATSEAHWWAYEIQGRFFLMRIEDLQKLVERAKLEGRVRRGGDYNLTEGALVPVEWLVFMERAE